MLFIHTCIDEKMSAETVLNNLHPSENISELIRSILRSLKGLHISCGVNCLEVTKSTENFVGICVFYRNGSEVVEDRGRRIKSGYIFAEQSTVLSNSPGNTMHRAAYNLIFDQIEHREGIVIIGFAQQNRTLKGTSRTFNSGNTTNLLPLSQRDGQCLFSLR